MGSLLGMYSGLTKAVGRALGGKPITYRLFVGSIYTPTTGQSSTLYHDVSLVCGYRRSVTVTEVGATPTVIQLGDSVFILPEEDLRPHFGHAQTKGLSTNDEIVDDGGNRWRVIATSQAPGPGAAYAITARRR